MLLAPNFLVESIRNVSDVPLILQGAQMLKSIKPELISTIRLFPLDQLWPFPISFKTKNPTINITPESLNGGLLRRYSSAVTNSGHTHDGALNQKSYCKINFYCCQH